MVKVVPFPGALATRMYPPLCFTIPYTVDSPSPVPLPCFFVVKNGSKIRYRTSLLIPVPLSATRSVA